MILILVYFLRAQKHVSKKFLNLDINLSGNLEYYIREILDGATDKKFDVHINSTSKLLFFCFNNFRRSFGLSTFAIRHTRISDDKYTLETFQNKTSHILLKQFLRSQMMMLI